MINMNLHDRKVLFVVLSIVAIVAFFTEITTAESLFTVESTKLMVYRDGLVNVKQTLIVNELDPDVTLSLVSSSNISITKKEAEVWTLNFNNPYNLTVFLPQNSTVIYLSEMPTAIDTSGTGMTLSLHPGYWEISYIVPLVPQDELDGNGTVSDLIPVEYLIAAIVAITAFVLSVLVFVKRKKEPDIDKILKANPQLRKEDKDVIMFLAEKDGKAFEAEIRERFPDMPRTSLWRLVRRLERMEIVEVKRIGLENQVQLK